MVKEYEITVWLDCEYCFTHKYSPEEIISLTWTNMPDDLFNDIIRETLLQNTIPVIKKRKMFILFYFISSIINAIFGHF